MHAIWDSVIYDYTGYETLPMDDATWNWYTSEALAISEGFPIDMTKLKNEQFNEWAVESYNIAQSAVYNGKFIQIKSNY